jgi:hypothetical protein
MPRTAIDLPYRVDFLSVLDENGRLDKELEPILPNELLLKLHRAMLLARRFDERMLSLQRQGRIGTFAPIKGQEAAQLGAVAALLPADWMVPSFREGAAEVWRGKSLESVLLYYAATTKAAGWKKGATIFPWPFRLVRRRSTLWGSATACSTARKPMWPWSFSATGPHRKEIFTKP